MIIDGILILLYATIQIIISPILLFDDVTLPSDFATSLNTAGTYTSGLNHYIPIDTIQTILVLLVYIVGAVLLYKLIMWGIKKIPGIN